MKPCRSGYRNCDGSRSGAGAAGRTVIRFNLIRIGHAGSQIAVCKTVLCAVKLFLFAAAIAARTVKTESLCFLAEVARCPNQGTAIHYVYADLFDFRCRQAGDRNDAAAGAPAAAVGDDLVGVGRAGGYLCVNTRGVLGGEQFLPLVSFFVVNRISGGAIHPVPGQEDAFVVVAGSNESGCLGLDDGAFRRASAVIILFLVLAMR